MRHDERGFTIIEILIALVVFAIIALGAIGALGVTTASGYLEAFPTSFSTVRTARDYTAAATYLQRLVEFAANQGFDDATVGTYCVEGPDSGTGCSPAAALPWGSPPSPDDQPFQLNWEKLEVEIKQWHWDQTNGKYCEVATTGCAASATTESVKLIQATLTWKFDEKSRSLAVKRLIEDCEDLIQGDVSFCVE